MDVSSDAEEECEGFLADVNYVDAGKSDVLEIAGSDSLKLVIRAGCEYKRRRFILYIAFVLVRHFTVL